MRAILLSCMLVAFLMSGQILALTCNPGSYVAQIMGVDNCLPCGVGYYCANGVKQEKCAFNTISSGSATSCTPCRNANRGTDGANSACLLPNTPLNATEFTSTIAVTSTQLISAYVKMNFLDYDYMDVHIRQTPAVPNAPITRIKVYGHRTTGLPGPGKYDGFENSIEPYLSYDNDDSAHDILYLSIYGHPDTLLTIDMERIGKRGGYN